MLTSVLSLKCNFVALAIFQLNCSFVQNSFFLKSFASGSQGYISNTKFVKVISLELKSILFFLATAKTLALFLTINLRFVDFVLMFSSKLWNDAFTKRFS